MTTVKAWLAESNRGEVSGVVDDVTLGYGEDEAVELDVEQVTRLRSAGISVQTDPPTSQADGEDENENPDEDGDSDE